VEWIKPLLGHTVGLDTAPLIYFIEKHPQYFPTVRPFFEAVERGDIQIITSTLTLTEVLIHPLRQGSQMLARQYSSVLLNASHVRTLAVSPSIATEAARLGLITDTRRRMRSSSPRRRPAMQPSLSRTMRRWSV
jgi:predicted nucleic acid-binding protein